MLVEVDDSHFTLVGAEGTERLVAMVDKGEVGEVGTDEWEAGGNVVLKALTQDCVVARHIHNAAELLEGSLGLLRYNVPGLLQSRDHRQV